MYIARGSRANSDNRWKVGGGCSSAGHTRANSTVCPRPTFTAELYGRPIFRIEEQRSQTVSHSFRSLRILRPGYYLSINTTNANTVLRVPIPFHHLSPRFHNFTRLGNLISSSRLENELYRFRAGQWNIERLQRIFSYLTFNWNIFISLLMLDKLRENKK